MDLHEIKLMDIGELMELARSMDIEGISKIRRQELVHRILSSRVRSGEPVMASGVLERLPEGYRFLRSPEHSYLPGPDDIFVSQ